MMLQNQSGSAGCCSLASHNFSQTFSETSICHRAMTHVAVSSACFVVFFFCSFFTCSPLRPPSCFFLLFCHLFVCLHNFPGDRAQIQQPPSEDLNRRQLERIHQYGRKFSRQVLQFRRLSRNAATGLQLKRGTNNARATPASSPALSLPALSCLSQPVCCL